MKRGRDEKKINSNDNVLLMTPLSSAVGYNVICGSVEVNWALRTFLLLREIQNLEKFSIEWVSCDILFCVEKCLNWNIRFEGPKSAVWNK